MPESELSAGTDSGELWKIVNAIRRPPSAAPPPIDLDELTEDYVVRLNPPVDPVAASFDPIHLADIIAHAASIPERSQEALFPSNDLLPPSQNGFRANNRTNNNPFILRTLIDKAHADGDTLYVAFVDISNAFSAMSHELLWLRMQELGLTGPFYDFIRKIYREMKLRVAAGGAVSEEWRSLCGVLMGDPVSPTLWNIFLSSFTLAEDPDDISLMGYALSHLEHADDMVLVSRSWEGLQRQLDQLGTWCRSNLLQVNVLKSGAMIFGPISPRVSRRPARCPTLCGESVPWLSQHKYVGIWFDSTCRDIFRAHYEHKHNAAAYVYWKTILGCDLYVGHGRLPPDVACQLYYALVDPHLTHGCDVMLDVDPVSFAWLDDLNRSILRRILGVGSRSGKPQLYSELGIYPLAVRRAELALHYLRYLTTLPDSHLARKALHEADRLRRKGKSSWTGDLARVLADLPFHIRRLPSLRNLSTQDKPPRRSPLCRRHYLTRVAHTNQCLALTRLLRGSFYFRGLRSDPDKHAPDSLLCRKCGEASETPGHVFLQCRARETVEARIELRDELRRRYGVLLGVLPSTRKAAEDKMRELIFNWETVIPMARFVYRVCKSWRWFGRKLPTMAREMAPDSADEWDEDVGSDDENSVGELD
uniref:Reverse transcriptase domain-containing protein n=1 Tax=Mycena chlorophos TaxID=658473 RepID=A0ABQ0L4Z2_MYCCL|nr:predicted protein [Mycena chlorophos]